MDLAYHLWLVFKFYIVLYSFILVYALLKIFSKMIGLSIFTFDIKFIKGKNGYSSYFFTNFIFKRWT